MMKTIEELLCEEKDVALAFKQGIATKKRTIEDLRNEKAEKTDFQKLVDQLLFEGGL